MTKRLILLGAALSALAVPRVSLALEPVEELGASLFFDDQLSNPPGQSCADCHDPAAGWAGPDSATNAGPAASST